MNENIIEPLILLLEDPNIIKCGVDIFTDFKRIRDYYNRPFIPLGCIDNQYLAKTLVNL